MIKTPLTILLSATLFTACSTSINTSHPVTPATGQSEGPKLPDGAGGYYKTGNPYQVAGRKYTPMQSVSSYDESGVASWYGADFHGKHTANGESYDMHTLSAAHKTLPLPTLVRVTNLENDRSVIVRVNDRGPFVKERLIDLSQAAANELGYLNQGTTRVRVQTLDQKPVIQAVAPAPQQSAAPAITDTATSEQTAARGNIYVQLGAFSSQGNADQLRQSMLQKYPNTALHLKQIANQTFYRVRIGPFKQMQQIEETMISLQNSGYHKAVVVIE